MKFNSQICTTRSQSETLLKLGLKKETADMMYEGVADGELPKHNLHPTEIAAFGYPNNAIPAWSLHRLIEMIPFDIWHTEYEGRPKLKHIFWFSKYAPSYNSYEDIDFRAHPTLYDNILDCIEWLIKEGHFNKEYIV